MSKTYSLSGEIKTEFYRIIVSPRTYFAVVCVIAVLFLNARMNGIFKENDSVYYLSAVLFNHIDLLLILCAALPFSTLFLDDWKHQYALLAIGRSGYKAYAGAKVIACFTGGWLVSFLGIHVFLGLLSLKIPFIGQQYEGSLWAGYSALGSSEFPYLYVFVIVSVLAAGYAFWAVLGLMISSYCTNMFMTIGLTVILAFYMINVITPTWPGLINISLIGRGGDLGLGVWGNFFYSIFFLMLLSLCAGILFYRRVKRRVSGEIH